MSNSISFTSLVEPPQVVSPKPPAAPFDAGMAFLLGQCCNLSYAQLATPITPSDFAKLSLKGSWQEGALTASNLVPFTDSEPGKSSAEHELVSSYTTVPAGFGVQLTWTPANDGPAQSFVVIALRGTRTWSEWLSDAEALPVPFEGNAGKDDGGLGLVHSGFYDRYTVGTNGQRAAPGDELSQTLSLRAPGSLALQVAGYVTSLPSRLPVYVTGHSLGGAMAALAALDIAHNFANTFSGLAMYSLASPRVAMGAYITVGHFKIPYLFDDLSKFLLNYQQLVPNTYQIVNAADIVPILPPPNLSIGPFTLQCAQVTDSPQTGASSNHVLNFCLQTGDIPNNHSCANTYVPYLAQLAGGFQAA